MRHIASNLKTESVITNAYGYSKEFRKFVQHFEVCNLQDAKLTKITSNQNMIDFAIRGTLQCTVPL